MSELWNELVRTYSSIPVDEPGLKIATLAQWALESDFGSSGLATDHLNFGGLKFRARINKGREDDPLAVPVDYVAHDGEDTYCKFASLEDFVAGYWAFVDNGAMYDGWRTFGEDPSGYIGHLHENGYAGDPDYVSKVIGLFERIRAQVAEMGLSEAFGTDRSTPAPGTKVALLIGHNSHARGAHSDHLAVSEWVYNQRVANKMVERAAEFGLVLQIFFRQRNPDGYGAEIAEAYANIDAWDPKAILELHFNAGGGRGTEMLYWHTSDRGKILADSVRRAVVSELGLNDRGSKGRRDGERGSTSLKASAIPTILTEPFFGDSHSDCDRMLQVGESGLGRAYLIGIRDAVERL